MQHFLNPQGNKYPEGNPNLHSNYMLVNVVHTNTDTEETDTMDTKHFKGTEKDYAISLGLAKAGRGRMSLDAKAAVAKAKADGMVFQMKGPATATVSVSKTTKKADGTVTKETVETEANQYADAFMRYPLDQMFVYEHEGKKYKVSGRLACMPCGYSLVGHGCNDPVVLTYHGQKKVKPVGE